MIARFMSFYKPGVTATKQDLWQKGSLKSKVWILVKLLLRSQDLKLSGKPEVNPKESVNAVAVRARQSTQRPHLPQDVGARRKTVTASHCWRSISIIFTANIPLDFILLELYYYDFY